MQAKELTVQKPRLGRYAQLPLSGKWLEEIGFTSGAHVYVVHAHNCLTFTTSKPSVNDYTIVCVTSRLVAQRPRTELVVQIPLLMKLQLGIGDRVGLTYSPGNIQIQKIKRFTTVA